MEVDYAPTEDEVKEREEDKPAPLTEFVFEEPSVADQVITPLIPPIALGITAFAVVGLVIWAGQRMSHAVSQSNYTQNINKAENYEVPDPNQPGGAAAAPFTQSATLPAPGARIAIGKQSGAITPIDRSLVTGPFIGIETRKTAKASIAPIGGLLTQMHQFDQKGLWNTDNASSTIRDAGGTTSDVTTPSDGVAPVTLAPPNAPAGIVPGMPMNNVGNSTRGATFQGGLRSGVSQSPPNTVATAIVSIDHVHMRTESLATMTDLTMPPEQFPEPLRAGVKAVSQELHLYLKDADLAATADPETRNKLRQHATSRLTAAQRMYDYMNGVIDGTANANTPPPL